MKPKMTTTSVLRHIIPVLFLLLLLGLSTFSFPPFLLSKLCSPPFVSEGSLGRLRILEATSVSSHGLCRTGCTGAYGVFCFPFSLLDARPRARLYGRSVHVCGMKGGFPFWLS